MSEKTDPIRNTPSTEGRNNDPDLRDETATQPGVSTIMKSETDAADQHVTRSAMDGPIELEFDVDDRADPAFDDKK